MIALKTDLICCCKSVSNGWQRCKILKVYENKTCKVKLLDIGLNEYTAWRNLLMLDYSFAAVHSYANRCLLVDMKTAQPIDHYTQVHAKNIKNKINEYEHKQFYVFINRINIDNKNEIFLYYKRNNEFECLNEILPMDDSSKEEENEGEKMEEKEMSQAKPNNDFKCSPRVDVVLCYFDSIDAVYLSLKGNDKARQYLHCDIQHFIRHEEETLKQSIAFKESDLCLVAAKIHDNDQNEMDWYRGKITSINAQNQCKVYLCDYGKEIEANVSELKVISEKLSKVQHLCRKYKLSCVEAKSLDISIRKEFLNLCKNFDGLSISMFSMNMSNEIILWGVHKIIDPLAPTRYEYTNINRELAKTGMVTATNSFDGVSDLIKPQINSKPIENDDNSIDEYFKSLNIHHSGVEDGPVEYHVTDAKYEFTNWLPSEKIKKSEFIATPM